MSARLLLDTSAWNRLGGDRLDPDRAAEVADAVAAGEVALSLPVLLEIGYSARSAREHEELTTELLALPQLPISDEVETRALEAQAELARSGHHRVPPPDLIVAALADRHGLAVLHYDADYDTIRERTSLRYDSLWLAPAGSL